MKILSVVLNGLSQTIQKLHTDILFPKIYPHRTPPWQILHQLSPNSNMFWFVIFQRKIHSVLLKGYKEVFENRPTKFCFLKIVHIEHWPHKYFNSSYQFPVCCFLVFSNSICIVLCSKNVSSCLEIPQRNFVAGLTRANSRSDRNSNLIKGIVIIHINLWVKKKT